MKVESEARKEKSSTRKRLHSTTMRMPLRMSAKLRAEKAKIIAFKRLADQREDSKSQSTNHHEPPRAKEEQIQNQIYTQANQGSGDAKCQTKSTKDAKT